MQLNSEGLITLDKRTELKPYKPRPFIEREFMTDVEIQANVGSTLLIDIELYPNYYCCNFKHPKLNKFIVLECGQGKGFNEKFLSWLMFNYRTVGFNSINYDLLILWLSYYTQDIATLKDASNDIILRGVREWELKKAYNFRTFNTNHVDLIEVAPLRGSLKLYMARLHAERIQELPFPDMQILTEEEIGIVKQYNFNDLDGTELLFNFMKERLELRESLGNDYHENLMSKSDAQIAEVILSKEISKLNGKRPQKQDIESGTVFKYSIPTYIKYQTLELQNLLNKLKIAKFVVQPNGKMAIPNELTEPVKINRGLYKLGIGGLHSSEKTAAYKSDKFKTLVDRDVRSYYPKLITTLGLYPPSCGPNFLIAFDKIIDIRLDAKEKKIFSRDKGLKIVINGTSGKLSDTWSIFYSPDNTIQMTVSGQLALLLLIERLELSGIEVISANTDGMTMIVYKNKELDYQQIVTSWEIETGFETEEIRYKNYYARDVGAYFATKLDDTVKKKGNPYAEVGSQSGTQLDVNPTVQICSDAVEALISKNIPIEQTIRECKNFTRFVNVRQAKAPGAHKNGEYLGRVLRWYYAKGETGAIHTVAANNQVAGSEGAKPCMDLPKEFPDDIDYAWYIKYTKEILEDIGYTPKMKQVEFF